MDTSSDHHLVERLQFLIQSLKASMVIHQHLRMMSASVWQPRNQLLLRSQHPLGWVIWIVPE